jgi:hypothetical protein
MTGNLVSADSRIERCRAEFPRSARPSSVTNTRRSGKSEKKP